jgi:hypothetical protein
MSDAQIEIQLTLNHLDEFFAEPDADPFDPDSRYISGIDEVMGQMRLRRSELDDPSRLVIKLPETAVTPDTLPTFKAALNRFCTAKIAENQQIIDELRVGSRRQTISAVIIAIALIILSTLMIYLVPALQAVSGAIAGFVGIAVWVIFWDPIYNYVYAWRPNYVDICVLKNLLTSTIVIETT